METWTRFKGRRSENCWKTINIYAADTILQAESTHDLKQFRVKVNKGSTKAGQQVNIKTTKKDSYRIITQLYNVESEEIEIV